MNKKDHPIKLLKFLFDHYTAWDVPLNTFLKESFDVGDRDINEGQKIVDLLNEFKKQNLITWVTQPNFDQNNNEPSLANYQFNARLTFEGWTYMSNRKDLYQQKRINLCNLIAIILTAIFIGVSVYYDIRNFNMQKSLQLDIIELKKTVKKPRNIN